MSKNEFSQKDIQMLAQLERDMDSGKAKYVVYKGCRYTVQDSVMARLGLESGQTINGAIYHAMMQMNIEDCQRKIGEKAIGKLMPKDF